MTGYQTKASPGTDTAMTRVISVTGGKGGVGKSNVSINLGTACAEKGQKVLIFDADLGLANIDVLLGLKPTKTIADVVNGSCSLSDILLESAPGVNVIPASSGTQSLVEMNPSEHSLLVQSFCELQDQYDLMIVDTAAGISDMVASFVCASQEVLVVLCNEPASIADAYALIKVLRNNYGVKQFRVLINMVESNQEARLLFGKLSDVCETYLDIVLQYVGCIPYDEYVKKSVKQKKSVISAYPRSKAAFAYRNLVAAINKWPMPDAFNGSIEFFIETVMNKNCKIGG